jgi:hypothetical protein
MARRKPPSLGPIYRGGVSLPFLDRDIKLTIPDDRDRVSLVVEAIRRLPKLPRFPLAPAVYQVIQVGVREACEQAGRRQSEVHEIIRLLAIQCLEGDDYYAALGHELTGRIHLLMVMDQLPEFDRMTDKQKLAQLDKLDCAMARQDEAFGQLRRETWNEVVVSARSGFPDTPALVRQVIYNSEIHEAIRKARRRLQDRAEDRGPRPNRLAATAAKEAGNVYQGLTGKEAKVYWDDATGTYKGECLSFLTEVFGIFGIEGDPAQYLRKD